MALLSATPQKATPVTIVTLTRDDQVQLKSTMESVATQSYRPIQYLIVNGGGSVDTLVAATDFQDGIAVEVVNGHSDGIYAAMNAALELVSGDWVNFMNAGDTFVNSTAVESVFENKDDGVSVKVMRLEGAPECQILWNGPFLKNICQQAIFYNCQKLSNLLHFDETYKLSADLELIVRIHEFDNEKFSAEISEAVVRYLPGGVSGQNQHTLFDEKLRILRTIKNPKNRWKNLSNVLYVYAVRLALVLKRTFK